MSRLTSFQEAAARFATRRPAGPEDRPLYDAAQLVDTLLNEACVKATGLMRAGRPGEGEYVLVRAMLKATRILGEHDASEQLSQLRYVDLQPRPIVPGPGTGGGCA